MDMDSAAQKIITVGKLKMTLPAMITVIGGMVVGLITALAIGWLTGIMMIFVFFVAAYNINCATVGHCTTWAWTLTIIYLINVAIFVFSAGMGVLMNPKLNKLSKLSRK